MSYTGAKGSHLANKKTKYWVQQKSKEVTEGTSGLAHRTVSGAPPNMSGAPEDSNSNSSPSGISRGNSAIIHRTVRCTPDSVRCSKEERPPELASLGNSSRLLRYNSPDMSGVHRTVRCNLGAMATSRQRSPAGAINARQKRTVVRHAAAGAPDTLQCMSGAPRCQSSNGRNRQNPNGWVTWLAHRTVRCAHRQQPNPNGWFGGWGYKYPQPPTIHCIQVFHFSTTYKS